MSRRRHPARLRPALLAAVPAILAAVLAAACGGGNEPEEPAPPPPPPDLTGARVMLLPAQVGSPAQLDAELAFWLTDRAPYVTWLLPEELQRAADRAPAWRVRLDAVPRRIVDTGGRNLRVADPLYGVLRRLGAVENTNVALVPVAVAAAADTAGPVVQLTAAVVDIRAGRVVWLGTVRGRGAGDGGEASVAAAAEALARALFPQ